MSNNFEKALSKARNYKGPIKITYPTEQCPDHCLCHLPPDMLNQAAFDVMLERLRKDALPFKRIILT